MWAGRPRVVRSRTRDGSLDEDAGGKEMGNEAEMRPGPRRKELGETRATLYT